MELQWPLILFTTFIAWSAGLFATQAAYALRGEGMKSQFVAWVVSAALLVAGGVSVFFHLQHFERLFNGFGHLSSGITQELIAIVVLAVVAVVYLAFLRRLDRAGGESLEGRAAEGESAGQSKMPTWLCWLSIAASVVLIAVMGHSYMMASRPAWDSALQVLSLVGAACALGPLTMMAICAGRGEGVSRGRTLALGGAAANAVLAVAYAAYLQMSAGMYSGSAEYYFDTPHPNAGMADVASAVAGVDVLLWVGAVVVGAVVPLVLALLARRVEGRSLAVASSVGAACAFAGALCMRAAFYALGFSAFLMY